MPLRALIIWFALLLVAVANGGFRESVLVPRFGPHTGHIVSTGMLCAGILIVAFLAIPWIHPASRGDTIAVGLAWLAFHTRVRVRVWPRAGQALGGAAGGL